MSERRDYQISIRIPIRIRDAIAKDAEAELRSFADVVNVILNGHYPNDASPKRSK